MTSVGLSEQLASVVEGLGPSIFRVEGRRIASAVAWAPDLLVTVNAIAGGLKTTG